jgi:hypothetical protein
MEEGATDPPPSPRERGGGGSPTPRGPRERDGGVERPPRPNGRPDAVAAPTPPRPRVRPGAPAAASKAAGLDPFFLRVALGVDIPLHQVRRGEGARRRRRNGEEGEPGGEIWRGRARSLAFGGRMRGLRGFLAGARGRRRSAGSQPGDDGWRRVPQRVVGRRRASSRRRGTGRPRRLVKRRAGRRWRAAGCFLQFVPPTDGLCRRDVRALRLS